MLVLQAALSFVLCPKVDGTGEFVCQGDCLNNNVTNFCSDFALTEQTACDAICSIPCITKMTDIVGAIPVQRYVCPIGLFNRTAARRVPTAVQLDDPMYSCTATYTDASANKMTIRKMCS